MEFEHGFALHEAELTKLEVEHEEFNEKCRTQLIEMTSNQINAIEDRGGIEGWEHGGDALTKTFEFDCFERGQAFVQTVSNFCHENDHHPEWKCENGGTVIQVRLTSHFAGNTVSILDYQLAEQMNNAHAEVQSTFNPYPMFNSKQLLHLSAAVGTFVFLYSGFTWMIQSEHTTDHARGTPLPRGHISLERKTIITPEMVPELGVERWIEEKIINDGWEEVSKPYPHIFNIR